MWELTTPASEDGWVIQHIVGDISIWGYPAHFNYWEAWFIKKDNWEPDTADGWGPGHVPPGVTSYTVTSATASWYPGLESVPGAVKDNPDTFAGAQPSTTTPPNLPAPGSNTVVRPSWGYPPQ